MLNTFMSANYHRQGLITGKGKKMLYSHLKSSQSCKGKFIVNNTCVIIDV